MIDTKVFDVIEKADVSRPSRGSKTPWKKIHYVTFNEVVNKAQAEAAKDPVTEEWAQVRQAFGDTNDIKTMLIAGAKKSGAYKNGDKVCLILTQAEFDELVKKAK